MTFRKIIGLGLLACSALAALTASSSADPITGAIAGITAFAAAYPVAFAVGQAVVGVALNVGLSVLSSILTRKPQSISGLNSELQLGADSYRQIIFGKGVIAGHFIYWKGVGKTNQTVYMVYRLCDWECDSLEGVYVNGEIKALTGVATVGSEHTRQTVAGYGSNLILKFFRGTMTQTADTELVTASADTAGGGLGAWTSNHKGLGTCYVIVKMTYDKDQFQSGLPELKFQVKGAKLYDLRKDSTNGGSGAHRFTDPTTWEWSGNPALCDYNFRRGFFRNTYRVLGMGMSSTDLLNSYYIAAANICDEALTEGGNAEVRYTVGAILGDDAEWKVAAETWKAAMAGDIIEKQGQFGPLAGASYATVATITDDDLKAETQAKFQKKRSRSSLYNGVAATYSNPNIGWESDPLTPLTNGTWEADDNGERILKDLDLRVIYKPYQARRVATIIHNLSRRQATHTGIYPASFGLLEPGDWVTRNFNRSGYGTYTMRVLTVKEVDPEWYELTMEEIATADYTAPGGTITPTPAPTVTASTVTATVSGLALTAITVSGTDGQTRPAIQVNWTPPADPGVIEVSLEYRVQGGSTSTPIRFNDPEGGQTFIQADILANTAYEVRARYERVPVIATTWTSWVAITTSSGYAVYTSVIATRTEQLLSDLRVESQAGLLATMLATLKGFNTDRSDAITSNTVMAQSTSNSEANITVEQTVRATIDQAYATINTALQATLDRATASITAEQLVRAAADDALAATVTTLTATVDGNSALARTETVARADTDSAMAATLTTVQATANQATANATVKLEAVAAPGGVAARIAFMVYASGDATWKQAGMYIDVVDQGGGVFTSRFVVSADLFAVITASGTKVPFAVIGDDVYINKVVVADQIVSSNYVQDVSGFKIGSDGVIRGENVIIGGGSSTKRPFELTYGYIQEEVTSDEPTAQLYFSKGDHNLNWVNLTGTARRTPTGVDYDLAANLDTKTLTGKLQGTAPRGKGMAWAPGRVWTGIDATIEYAIFIDKYGDIYENKITSAGVKTSNRIGSFLNVPDRDPMFTAGTYTDQDTFVWKFVLCGGIRRIRVPDTILSNGIALPVARMRAWMWGAAGQAGTGAGNNGGPGGYTKADHAVTAGEILSLLVGGYDGQGYGGASQSINASSTKALQNHGGGGSFLWRGPASRPSLLQVAGGGSSGGAHAGNPGGSSNGGGNGVSGTGMDVCLGLTDFTSSGGLGSGGGGYVGGGTLAADGKTGKGGTNFIIGTATNTTNSASAEDANFYSTTTTPPGTSEAVYIANSGNDLLRANVGASGSGVANAGPGMIVVQFFIG